MVWIPPTHRAHLDGPSGAPARHRSLRLLAHILLPVALPLPSSALAPSIDWILGLEDNVDRITVECLNIARKHWVSALSFSMIRYCTTSSSLVWALWETSEPWVLASVGF